MKFISWNVNGIRACVQKGFLDFFKEADADIFCIQESKMQEGQLKLSWKGIISSGTMQSGKGTRGQQFLRNKSRFQLLTELEWKNMTRKGVSSHWNLRSSIL